MADFDYGNARLRALKSQLLRRADYERLIDSGSVEGLLAGLLHTAYRPAVETALARQAGPAAVGDALRRDLAQTINRRRHFYAGEAGVWVMRALLPYDVFNIKTVLRGLRSQVPADHILNATLPLGALDEQALRTLASAPDPRHVIDLLATWQSPLAAPLLRQRAHPLTGAQAPYAPLVQEIALERWLAGVMLTDGSAAWRELAQCDVDSVNLLTALRLVGVSDIPFEPLELLVGPGRLPFERLLAASRAPDVTSAVALFADTIYAAALQDGLAAYAVEARFSLFEEALRRLRLNQAARLFARDPLGIGVVLGFLALKTNEVANLQLLAQGLVLGESPTRLRARLLLAENLA